MDSNAFIDRLFDRARAAGFEACEAYLTECSAFQVNVNAGEITRYNVSESRELGFRGLWRGRMGCASTQALDDEAAEMLVSAARSGSSSARKKKSVSLPLLMSGLWPRLIRWAFMMIRLLWA